MMNILIVVATDKEIAPLMKHLTRVGTEQEKVEKYAYQKHAVDVLITGVGMVATTYWLTKILTVNKYDIALNIGIAGSFEKELKIGTVVNVVKDCFAEMGAEDGDVFLPLTQLHLMGENDFPYTNRELINTTNLPNSAIHLLQTAKGITVNKVHGNEASIKKTMEFFFPQVESMEGAAFLYVSLLEKIPCFQIRAISNFIEKRNREKWNIPLAIENVNRKVLEILNCF